MALLLRTDGTTKQVTPASGATFTLPELQALVGGHIEVVRLFDVWLVCNDDGKRLELPHNHAATAALRNWGLGYDWIVGDALLVETASGELD